MLRGFRWATAGLAFLASAGAEEVSPSRVAELARDREVRAEADRVAGTHALAAGRRLMEEGRLEEAEEAFALASGRMPASREAREELQGVRGALGAAPDRRREILQALALERGAREDQARALVEGKIREGERRIREGRPGEALRVLQEGQEVLRWMPPEAGSERWARLLRELTAEAERGIVQEAARRRESLRTAAASAAARELADALRREERRLKALRAEGEEALGAGRWDQAERLSREIAVLRRGDPAAARLDLLAREGRHASARAGLALRAAEEWANQRESSREQGIPYGSRVGKVLRYPDGWKAARDPEARSGEEAPEAAWNQALDERLGRPVHYRFDTTPFKDALEYLGTQGRVVFQVDKLAREACPALEETAVSLASPEEGSPLGSTLNLLARQAGLRWTLRDGTVTFTTEAGLEEPETEAQYDIRDLVLKPKDYPGPVIRLGASGPGIEIDKEEEREDGVTGAGMLDFLRGFLGTEALKR